MKSKITIFESDLTLPKISVNLRKYFPEKPDDFIKLWIKLRIGAYLPYDNIVILTFGTFGKSLLTKYHKTIEKQTCDTISHEIMHFLLFNEHNIKVSSTFDNIAEKLFDYGVY